MANNLRRLRVARRWTQEEAAAAFGTTRNQYAKLETGTRRLSAPWIDRAAGAFRVDPGEVVQEGTEPSIVGRLLEDCTVDWMSDDKASSDGEAALAVSGNTFSNLFGEGYLVFKNERRKPQSGYDGQLTLVRTDTLSSALVCRVYDGSRDDRFHLVRLNSAPQFDQKIVHLDRIVRLVFY